MRLCRTLVFMHHIERQNCTGLLGIIEQFLLSCPRRELLFWTIKRSISIRGNSFLNKCFSTQRFNRFFFKKNAYACKSTSLIDSLQWIWIKQLQWHLLINTAPKVKKKREQKVQVKFFFPQEGSYEFAALKSLLSNTVTSNMALE